MCKYRFEATIKSVMKKKKVTFQIVPTSKYLIKSPKGKYYYVAFNESEKNLLSRIHVIDDKKLSVALNNLDKNLELWFCLKSDTGQSVLLECDKDDNIVGMPGK